jgi:selenocysteine-specific translation elongation factor
VSLLENDLAELVFDSPLWLADNDRLVLRDISARETLAGARVVTLNRHVVVNVSPSICSGWQRWRRRRMIRLHCWFIWSAVL